MTTTTIDISDTEIIKLVLEFLGSHSFDISLLSLERETGIINGAYSEDALFLRQLIMDGQWDDALDFVKPLMLVADFDSKKFHYLIVRYKYLELLCLKSEPGPMQQNDFTLDEVVKCLAILEELCPDKKEFSNLCFLLTLPKLSQHEQYRDWNPCSARVQCFSEVYPLVRAFIPPDREAQQYAGENRLLQLLVKGVLYEACIDYCQQKAIGNTSVEINMMPRMLTDTGPCCDTDLSLLSWLQSIPHGTFSCPFEQKSLKLRTMRLEKPALQAAWSEHILLTPIKPNKFPHCAMPARTRPAEALSRSLIAQYDGLSYGLARNSIGGSGARLPTAPPGRGKSVSALSASHSGAFRLSNSVIRDRRHDRMSASVEKLFASAADVSTIRLPRRGQEAGGSGSVLDLPPPPPTATESCPDARLDVSGAAELGRSSDVGKSVANSDPPSAAVLAPSKSEGRPSTASSASKPTSAAAVTAAALTPSRESTRPHGELGAVTAVRPEASGDYSLPKLVPNTHEPLENGLSSSSTPKVRDSVGELYSEYQKQKQRISEQLEQHERLREAMWQQLHHSELAEAATAGGSSGGSTGVAAAAALPHQQQQQLGKDDLPGSSQGSGRGSSGIMCDSMIETDGGPTQYQSSSATRYLSSSVGQPLNEIYEEPEQFDGSDEAEPNRFVSVCSVEDSQAIRAVAFHPHGTFFAVGANSKLLRVCKFPDIASLGRLQQTAAAAEVVCKHGKLHKGSIYCLAWSGDGRLLASGSNDHRVKLLGFDSSQPHSLGSETELAMHDGTVRDLAFLSDRTLVSGGAGNNHAYVVDCSTGSVVRELSGHTAPILAVHSWTSGGSLFVTGSQDKTARVWDTRAAASILHFVAPAQVNSAFASVCVETSGRVLASGHEDSSCLLYDIRGGRLLQHWNPHDDEIRCLRFSPSGLYLLTSSYDGKVRLADIQGDLTAPLPTVDVARHADKVIQCRWHPQLLAFVTTSADKTATCWAIPIG